MHCKSVFLVEGWGGTLPYAMGYCKDTWAAKNAERRKTWKRAFVARCLLCKSGRSTGHGWRCKSHTPSVWLASMRGMSTVFPGHLEEHRMSLINAQPKPETSTTKQLLLFTIKPWIALRIAGARNAPLSLQDTFDDPLLNFRIGATLSMLATGSECSTPGAHSICPQKQNQIRWSGRVGRSIWRFCRFCLTQNRWSSAPTAGADSICPERARSAGSRTALARDKSNPPPPLEHCSNGSGSDRTGRTAKSNARPGRSNWSGSAFGDKSNAPRICSLSRSVGADRTGSDIWSAIKPA